MPGPQVEQLEHEMSPKSGQGAGSMQFELVAMLDLQTPLLTLQEQVCPDLR